MSNLDCKMWNMEELLEYLNSLRNQKFSSKIMIDQGLRIYDTFLGACVFESGTGHNGHETITLSKNGNTYVYAIKDASPLLVLSGHVGVLVGKILDNQEFCPIEFKLYVDLGFPEKTSFRFSIEDGHSQNFTEKEIKELDLFIAVNSVKKFVASHKS